MRTEGFKIIRDPLWNNIQIDGGALAVLDGLSLTSLKILLLVLFIGIGSPTFTHALGRAAIRAGRAPWLREDRR